MACGCKKKSTEQTNSTPQSVSIKLTETSSNTRTVTPQSQQDIVDKIIAKINAS